jgi:cell fate regulator YaaT (PSP1 superfamily)
MSQAVGVQFNFWDRIYDFEPGELQLKVGDQVVVRTEQGMEIGTVCYVGKEIDEKVSSELKSVIRKATAEDQARLAKHGERREEILNDCRRLIRAHALPMKLVNVYFSFEGSRLTFTFTADSRVDFRALVRDLTRQFQKSIRLQQVGSRDEARSNGGFGMCGRELCCRRFLKEFSSITTDMARAQQMTHRGSERISGVCGRLMCCLAYEEKQYQEWLAHAPEIGTAVRVKQGRGCVIDRNLPRQTVKIRLDDKEQTVIEVPITEMR